MTRKVVIIGGGASGCLAAIHALKLAAQGLEITIVERRSYVGRGLAYSTQETDHRLNVRASNMSLFVDDPSNFARWLATLGIRSDDFDHFYAPRCVFGDYIASTLADAAERSSGTLVLIQATALSLVQRDEGITIALSDGSKLEADFIVLATGHEESSSVDRPYAVRLGSPQDTGVDPHAPVMILGTGLSMADVWLSLNRRGHRAPVIALSRRGLFPLGHEGHSPIKLDRASVPTGTGLTDFVRWFRAVIKESEQEGRDWRDVVDGLRPHNQSIWRSWSVDARRRFFEHTKPWWDIHRHRMAPEIRQKVFDAQQSGLLRVIAARVKDVKPGDRQAWSVDFQHRHSRKAETVEVDRIYDCQGIISDLSASSNPLLQSMITQGSARPDFLKIGLDVSDDCAVINSSGEASRRVFALGPLTRGAFLEIDAIPDIRVQAQTLMRRLLLSG